MKELVSCSCLATIKLHTKSIYNLAFQAIGKVTNLIKPGLGELQ